VPITLRVSRTSSRKFREVAAKERRGLNDQWEIIFEDWLRLTGRLRQAQEGLEEVRVEPLPKTENKALESKQPQSGKKKASGHSHHTS